MLYDMILSFLKFVCSIGIRMVLIFFLWNYALIPKLNLPPISFLTAFHIWLIFTVISSSFVLEQIEIPNDEDEDGIT